MRLHSTLVALTALAAMAAAPAQAGDAAAGTSWSGRYVGVGAGAGFLTTDQYSPPQLTYLGYHAASYDGWHPYASVQAGLDLQLGLTVLGVRLQHAVTNSKGDSFLKVDELVTSNAIALTSLSTRAGYLFEPGLLGYATAGVVVGHFDYASIDERWSMVDLGQTATRFGWSLGAGVEYRVTDQVSVFAEYTHVQFATGSTTFDYEVYPGNWTYEYTHSLGTLQAGVNFRF